MIVTGEDSKDQTLQVWNVDTGESMSTVAGVSFNGDPEGNYLFFTHYSERDSEGFGVLGSEVTSVYRVENPTSMTFLYELQGYLAFVSNSGEYFAIAERADGDAAVSLVTIYETSLQRLAAGPVVSSDFFYWGPPFLTKTLLNSKIAFDEDRDQVAFWSSTPASDAVHIFSLTTGEVVETLPGSVDTYLRYDRRVDELYLFDGSTLDFHVWKPNQRRLEAGPKVSSEGNLWSYASIVSAAGSVVASFGDDLEFVVCSPPE